MNVAFTKAHGAGNDFLLTRELEAVPEADWPVLARAICDRHRGVGADGLIVFTGPARIRLFNSDGSEAELSGNGTRCAAALLIAEGHAGESVEIETGAGVKRLRMLERAGNRFRLEMGMGRPRYSAEDLNYALETSMGTWPVNILDVGNPQCAVLVDDLDFDWRSLGREIESHPRFPRRTNVSFVRVLDSHTVEVRFYERGAGPTMSSGTGSTGAMAAAILAGRAESPVRVITEAGELELEWRDEIVLRGPAEITARGEYYWRGSSD
ncbi:MAG: diaminopimelate epimerase [Acidobacteria bacterium]|nr:diaminopimelate epimerase [Acidobacteriota bacterium]